MADILVTGGVGFIGTNLTAELRRRGHSVWTCDLLHSRDPQHVRADTGEYRQMEAFFRQRRFDYVYHLAAEYGRWNGEDHYEHVWRTNVVGTKHLLRLQNDHRFRTIFFSSAEVYGDFDRLMSEDVMEAVPIQQMNDYAISKWAGELQCLNHAAMFGTEIVRVRPVGCYGPHEYYNPYRGVIPDLRVPCTQERVAYGPSRTQTYLRLRRRYLPDVRHYRRQLHPGRGVQRWWQRRLGDRYRGACGDRVARDRGRSGLDAARG